MGAMSLAEVLNPSEWRRHRDREARLEVEGYKLNQAESHHRNEMQLGYDKLRLEARITDQDDIQHRDRMTALARRDELDERRVSGSLAIDRDRLEFDRQNSLLGHEVAIRTAEIQAQNALELAHLNHSNAMQQLSQQAHADMMRAASMLPIASAEAALRRGEDQNRAITGALADVLRAKINQKMTEKLEDKREIHRSNERRHEVKMAVLKARLDEHGFTHEEITKLIFRLADPTTSTDDKDDEMLFHKYQSWFNSGDRKE